MPPIRCGAMSLRCSLKDGFVSPPGRTAGVVPSPGRGQRNPQPLSLLPLSQSDPWAAAVLFDENDARSLQCLPQTVHSRLPRVRPIFDARHGIGRYACSFSEFSNTPTDSRPSHPELNWFHCYIVQIYIDTVHF
jgi:hypothetical protein